ncbi:MAG: hypothetical protein ACC608_10910 [Anaerofustis sp.]
MVNLICGPIGCGKTQKLIDSANSELKNTNGLIVYIDNEDKHRRNIDNQIRFINAREFMIENADQFFGFICGIAAENYDVNRIFIDNIISTARLEDNIALKNLLAKLNAVCEKTELEIFITLDSADADFIDENECNYQTV